MAGISRVGVGSSWANSESVEISVAELSTSLEEDDEVSSETTWNVGEKSCLGDSDGVNVE